MESNSGTSSQPDRSGRDRLVRASCNVGVFGLALGIALYGLGRADLWHDEAASLHFARLSLSELPGELARRDNHGPTYFAFLHAWASVFGEGAFAARLPSALAAALACVGTTWIGQRIAGLRAGVAAGVLLATSPMHLWHAQEVRFYAPALMLVTAQVAAAMTLCDRPTRRRAAVLGATALLGFSTFYLVGLVSIAIAAGAFLGRDDAARASRRHVIGAFAGAAAVGLLWVPSLIEQSRHALRFLSWIPDRPIGQFLVDVGLEAVAGEGGAGILPSMAIIALCLASAVFVAATIRRRRPDDLLITFWLVLPLVVVLVLSLRQSFLLVRYLYIALPALYVAAAAGIALLSRRRPGRLGGWALAAVGAGLVLPAQGLGLLDQHSAPKRPERWREAVAWVRPQLRAGDVLAVAPHWDLYTLELHFDGAGPFVALRADEDSLSSLGNDARRLWVLQSFDEGEPTRIALREDLTLSDERTFGTLHVDRFELARDDR